MTDSDAYAGDADGYEACVAAQRLVMGAHEYQADGVMFRAACHCWRHVCVIGDGDGKPQWNAYRELGWYTVPHWDGRRSTDAVRLVESCEVEYLPLHQLQALVAVLSDKDMLVLLRHLFIETATCFHTLFTDAFVGTDARLVFMRAFVGAADATGATRPAGSSPWFFDGQVFVAADFAAFADAVAVHRGPSGSQAELAAVHAAGKAAGKRAEERRAANPKPAK